MKKKEINFAGILILVTAMMCCGYGYVNADPTIKFISFYIGSKQFTVEVMNTPKKQETGMMFRDSMPDDFGMLFPYTYDDFRGYWMKNCKVHLDIIFLDRDKRIINIHSNVPPCPGEPCQTYMSKRPARYVLELRGKRAEELALKPGDMIDFKLE